jgi:hypothetical protein
MSLKLVVFLRERKLGAGHFRDNSCSLSELQTNSVSAAVSIFSAIARIRREKGVSGISVFYAPGTLHYGSGHDRSAVPSSVKKGGLAIPSWQFRLAVLITS